MNKIFAESLRLRAFAVKRFFQFSGQLQNLGLMLFGLGG
jgi:hypothetical protein